MSTLQPAKRQKTSHGDRSDCANSGQIIAGFIIPSKSPLGQDSVKQMMEAHKNIGLVIDLTNTPPCYTLQEFTGVKHVKIPCNSLPDNDSVNKFVYTVSEFKKRSAKQILVHCTHGFNRTGYMIAHYLRRAQPEMSVSLAIKVFADARPPGIQNLGFIEALYTFYHEEKPDKTLPCLNDDKINGELGDVMSLKQQEELRLECFELLKLPVKESGGLQFPGSRPVPVTTKTVRLLGQSYYRATWKTNGERYLMLIKSDGCYLIDSNFKFRRVQMRFPCARTNDQKVHHMTLLDGEMVMDTFPGSGKKERRFLVSDMMAVNGVCISEQPFFERWKMIEKEVIEPRNQERSMKSPGYYHYELEQFRMRRKDFWELSFIPKLLKDFIPNKLTHPADGLVFQAWTGGYAAGAHHSVLRWMDVRKGSSADVNVSEEMLMSEVNKTMKLLATVF